MRNLKKQELKLLKIKKTPRLVTRKMLQVMRKESVIVDVAVDQGGCVETTHPTTQDNPIFEVKGVIHYCVTNMPAVYPETSTFALTNVTLPYVLKIANKGYKNALRQDSALARGLNVIYSKLTCREVAKAHNLPYSSIAKALN